MQTCAIAERVEHDLREAGAALVGFADVREINAEEREGLDYAVSLALALDPAIIAGITDGPTLAYTEEYERTNAELGRLTQLAADLLTEQGYRAVAVHPTEVPFDRQRLRGLTIPHKTAATRAGLGWIGKSALLVTEEFGSALRFATVLTDAALPVCTPINTSRCGECTRCVEHCPGDAPTGRNWNVAMSREDFFDAFACARTARERSGKIGIPHLLCGACILACPWTERYLQRSGVEIR
ncbi:MAG: 4Fe-4S double cluster binding domain-containing protein [Armatimonadota bacterium]